MEWVVTFTDGDGVEAAFQIAAGSADLAERAAAVAYAQMYRRPAPAGAGRVVTRPATATRAGA